jgi:hypothetical protein
MIPVLFIAHCGLPHSLVADNDDVPASASLWAACCKKPITGTVTQLDTARHKSTVPAVYKGREFAAAGGLTSYGSNVTYSYRLAGIYTGRVLKGDKPVSLFSRGAVEHHHSASVLRPAGDIVAHCYWALLAVRNRVHALRIDAARSEIVTHGLCAPSAQRNVVFTCAALVGMAFDGEDVLVVVLQPLCLLLQRCDRLRGQFRRIGFEEDPVAHIDNEVLLASRRGHTGGLSRVGSVRASPQREGKSKNTREFCAEDGSSNDIRHSGAPIVASLPDMSAGLAATWLTNGCWARLMETALIGQTPESPKPFVMVDSRPRIGMRGRCMTVA